MSHARLSWKPLAVAAAALLLLGGGATAAVLLTSDGGDGGGGSFDATARLEAACGIAGVRPEVTEETDLVDSQEAMTEAALFAGAATRDESHGDLTEPAKQAIEAANTAQMDPLADAMDQLEEACTDVTPARFSSGEERFEDYADLGCRLAESMAGTPFPEDDFDPEGPWVQDGYAMTGLGFVLQQNEDAHAYRPISQAALDVGKGVTSLDEKLYTEALDALGSACEDR